jgi:hypothetical protein
VDKYYVDRPLTNVLVGRKRPQFIAERCAPTLFVDEISGVYWVRDSNDATLITQNTVRAPGNSPHSLYTEKPTTTPWAVLDHSLQDSLPDEYNRTMDTALRKEANKVEAIMDALDLVKEVNFLTKCASTLINATTPATKFDVHTGGTYVDPIEYLLALFIPIEDAITASPNFLAMDVATARAIINHPYVKERGLPTMGPDRYNTGRETMERIIRDLLGLDEVMIAAGSVRNTARKKKTANIVRTWSGNMLLGYKEEPTLDGYAGMAFHAVWNPGAEEGEEVREGKLVERERLDGFRRSWGFAVHDYYSLVFANSRAARWIPSVLTGT